MMVNNNSICMKSLVTNSPMDGQDDPKPKMCKYSYSTKVLV